MENYLSVEQLLKEAKNSGVKFGKGDPYNRLRYYTKIGWISHMKRKRGKDGGIKGHYPASTVDRLVLIQKLKDQGMTNEEISSQISRTDWVGNVTTAFRSDEVRNKAIAYGSFLMILLVLLSQIGLFGGVNGRSNQVVFSSEFTNIQIIDSGTAFVPREKSTIFVKSEDVLYTSKVYVTFKDNYAPATRYWVSEQKTNDGFVVELDSPTLNNAEFDWWITN